MSVHIIRFPVRRKSDIRGVSQRARLLGTLLNLTHRQRSSLGRAIAEVCAGVLEDAVGCSVQLGVTTRLGQQFLEAVVRSEPPVTGNGTPQRERRSPSAAQHPSWEVARRLVDQVRADWDSNGAAVVCLGIPLGADVDLIVEEDVSEWRSLLEQTTTEDALAVVCKRVRDLTAQLSALDEAERLEHQLHDDASANETLALLSLVASKTDNAVIIMGADGSAAWVNEAFVRMTGYSADEIIGRRPDRLLFGTSTNSESVAEIEESFRHGHGLSDEFLQYRKDGKTFWALWNLTPVFDERGSVSRWIAVGTDITKRRQAQAALEVAKESAEAASRAKSEFLANMSHEIRTPLNAVIGMTELTLATDLAADQRDYLNTVKYSADSLLELLNDILDLSKIEAGKMEIEAVPFDLTRLVRTTLRSLEVRAIEKDLNLEWHIPGDMPSFLLGDPIRLRQVLVNLVGNAIKFTEGGKVVVEVEELWQSDGEIRLHFSVHDTGIGISPDKLDTIFEVFTQADSSTTRRFGGTGLGLAISSQLVQLMRGKISAQSETGRGSTFHFSLRFRIASENEIGEIARPQDFGAADTIDVSPERLHVLIADDQAANRTIAGRILEKRGHQVTFADNGNEALIALKRQHFDVIVMDVQMPDMDGLETTEEIRRHERQTGAHVPIVALTAHAMAGDRERCLGAGMDAYLPKPLRAQQFQTLVEKLGIPSSFARERDGSAALLQPECPTDAEFDFTSALERLDGDTELLKEQMQFFVVDSAKLMEEIDAAIRRDDGKTLQFAAHRLKGLIASYDVHDAADLALKLEFMGRDAKLDDATKTYSLLARRVDDLRNAMGEYLAGERLGGISGPRCPLSD